eukprot:7156360-Prorocentrum_lima.AAC.1
MDGGKSGNQAQYLQPFSGCAKAVRTIMLHKEEESLHTRMGKAQGVALAPIHMTPHEECLARERERE